MWLKPPTPTTSPGAAGVWPKLHVDADAITSTATVRENNISAMIHCRREHMRFLLLMVFAVAACAAPPAGSAIFESHCATCHQTEAGSRIPTRAELGNLTPEQVMTALLRGKMTIQGSVLSTAEVRAVAAYATGKSFSAVDIDPAANRCAANPKPFAPGAGDWNGWGADALHARYQAKPGFRSEDASRLKLKWAFGFPDDTQAAGQPVVVSGRIFVGSNGGTVYSLDASP